MTKILHLEDNLLDARLIHERLIEEGLNPEPKVVSREAQFIEALNHEEFEIILADYYLPGFNGLKALQIVQSLQIDTPVILISGKLGEESAVESLKQGAVDYILKDNLQRLGPAVRRALEEHIHSRHSRKMEEELIKNAELFRTAESIGQMGTFEWNFKRNEVHWSNGIFEIFHEDKESTTPDLDLYISHIHPDDRSRVSQNLQGVVETGTGLDSEYRIITSHGIVKYLRTMATVTLDKEGNQASLIGVCQDITASVKVREELEKSEEKYRTLVEQATDGILISDADLRIEETNHSALQILECEDESQLIGHFPETFLTPGEISRNPIDRQAISTNPVTNVREVITFKQQLRHLEITSKTIPGGRVQIVFRDVTDREQTRLKLEELNKHLDERVKQAVAEARENADKYRLISENSSDLITQSTADGRLTYVSPSVREILGQQTGFYSGKLFCSLIPEEHLDRWGEALKALFEDARGSFTLQHKLIQANGQHIWVETVCKAIRDDSGEVAALQTASRDIHIRKQAEEETKRALDRERELNDLRAQFVSMASHQFRTPLTVINSNVQLMELIGIEQYDPRVKQILKRITRETERLTDLMNDVLILGKLNARRLDTNMEFVNIAEFVQNLIDNHVPPQEDMRNLMVTVSGNATNVYLDPSLTEHILSNLINNAFKYSPGARNPQLSIECQPEACTISIRDWGIGVPPEDRDHLFQSFYRGNNTREFSGTGLGLVIAREFMDLQGGKIGHQQPEGKGSIFWISFPEERSIDALAQESESHLSGTHS